MNILYLTYLVNGLLMIVIPIILAYYLARRFKTGWRWVWIGAGTFILSQVGHIPFNIGLTALFRQGILPSPPDSWQVIFNAILLGLSAGLWEELARYATYRWWAKDARSWSSALLLGSGHGGVESIILGLLVIFTYLQMVALRTADLSTVVPPEQLSLAQAQVEAYWSAPWYSTLLGALERLFALFFHLGASVLVLQVFIRRQFRWLIIAVAWHAFVDAVAVILLNNWGAYIAEIFIGIVALISIGIIIAFRQTESIPLQVEDRPAVLDVQKILREDFEETEEKIAKTRYN